MTMMQTEDVKTELPADDHIPTWEESEPLAEEPVKAEKEKSRWGAFPSFQDGPPPVRLGPAEWGKYPSFDPEDSVFAKKAREIREMLAKAASFHPKRQDGELYRRMFTEDPLAFIRDRQIRDGIEFLANRGNNPEREMESWALAAYFAQIRKEDIRSCHDSIDALTESWFGRKTDVHEAYLEMGRIFDPQISTGDVLTEYGNQFVSTVKAIAAKAGRSAADYMYLALKAATTDPAGDAMNKIFL